jgi:hypothetical protein
MAVNGSAHFLNPPWIAAQHIKAELRDHGLNAAADAIVIWLQGVLEAASGGIFGGNVELQRTGAVKMPCCIAGHPTGSIGSGRSTAPAQQKIGE